MAWPDDPITEPDFVPGYINDATLDQKVTRRFNTLVGRVGIVGPVTSGATAAVPTTPAGATSGTGLATINAQRLVRSGPMIFVQMNIKLGASVTVPADGDIINFQVAQLVDPFVPASYGSLSSAGTGPLCQFVLYASGALNLVSCVPGATLTSSTVLSLSGPVIDL